MGELVVVNGVARTFEFMPQQLGAELGVWTKRGLTPVDLYVKGGGQVGQTMAAGEGDIGLTTGASGLAPILAGLDAPIIAEVGRDFTLFVLCVRADDPALTADDVKGYTIGITSPGSGTDFSATSLAVAKGWELGTDLNKAAIGGLAEQVASLQAKATDGFIWTAEACFTLEEQGEAKVLFSFGDIVKNNLFESVVAQRAVIEERPEAVLAYLEGWYETVEWMKANRAETIEWLVKNWELSETVASKTYDLDIDNLSSDGLVPLVNLEGLAQSMVTIGRTETAPPVSSFWDGRFVPVALG